MLIENMQIIHDPETIERLTSEENKLYRKLQYEILDDTNFSKGTIFENIITINE